ncbi:FkbM family methyltransferase [Carboxylicivirga sp. RSCT41]|uniref:FkbM family methyltransferase n=1 Tax=Carboxylicivirga agarovorans TaxID=3417570 RepID=UPI003D3287CB
MDWKKIELTCRRFLGRVYSPDLDIVKEVSFYGDTDDGGWPLWDEHVDSGSIVYSFGVGTNISWEETIIKHFGLTVFSFDPNPMSISWLNDKAVSARLRHHEIALGWKDSKELFFLNRENIAGCGLVKSSEHREQIEVQCLTLSSIMKQLGHASIDVLKIDIEGAEYEVIDNILDSSVAIGQLLVEFHHRSKGDYTIKDTKKLVNRLKAAGYKLFWFSERGRELAFLNEKY